MLVFHLIDSLSGDAYDATDCSANFTISGYVNRTSPVLTKFCNVERSTVIANVLSEDTQKILPGKYFYQLTVVDPGGNVEVPARGFVFIAENIDVQFLTNWR